MHSVFTHPKRRTVLAGLAALALSPLAFQTARAAGSGNWRASGSHTRLPITLLGGNSRSQCTKSVHVATTDFATLKVVLPTFVFSRGDDKVIREMDLPGNYIFSCAIFVGSQEDIAEQDVAHFSFSGQRIASYGLGQGPRGFIVSDPLDLGATIKKGAKFTLFTTVECTDRQLSEDCLPCGPAIGSSLRRDVFEGLISTPESLIGTGATGFAGEGMKRLKKPRYGYTPLILTEAKTSQPCVAIVGDSIAYGVGEGSGGNGKVEDERGSEKGETGWAERWLGRLGYSYANLSKGSDRFEYFSDSANSRYRLQLLALVNPTHVLITFGSNDIAGGRGETRMAEDAINSIRAIRQAVPGIPVIGATVLPMSLSPDGHWTDRKGRDQEVRFAKKKPYREIWNRDFILSDFKTLGADAVIDPGSVGEMAPKGSSKWVADGRTPDLMTADGTHPSSAASILIAKNLAGNPFK